MRDFIKDWGQVYPDEIVRITDEINPKYEIIAVTKKFDLADKYPIIIF